MQQHVFKFVFRGTLVFSGLLPRNRITDTDSRLENSVVCLEKLTKIR